MVERLKYGVIIDQLLFVKTKLLLVKACFKKEAIGVFILLELWTIEMAYC